MKNFRKLTALLLALAMVLALVPGAIAEEGDTIRVALGSSGYTVAVPLGYFDAGVGESEIGDELVSVYITPENAPDFDVYQIEKTDIYPTLAAFMNTDCIAYDGTDLVLDGSINGITVASYNDVEELNGNKTNVANYAFDAGDAIIELCFHLTSKSTKAADEIMSTLEKSVPAEIELGTTGLAITVPYPASDRAVGDDAGLRTGIVCSHYVEEADLFIDIYEMNGAPMTLADTVALVNEKYGETEMMTDLTINEIPVLVFAIPTDFDNEVPQTYAIVLMLENNSNGITAVVFHVNNYAQTDLAYTAVNTLAPYTASGEETLTPARTNLALGTSGLVMTVAEGFECVTPSLEEQEDGLLGIFTNPRTLYDFDVYQFSKEGYASLADFNEQDAALCNGTELYEDEVNGIPYAYYVNTVEAEEGEVPMVVENYTFETLAGDEYVQVCFSRTQDKNAADDVAHVVSTIAKIGVKTVEIGGGYKLTVSDDYTAEKLEDLSGDFMTVTHFESPTGICFYVYEINTGIPEFTLEAYAATMALLSDEDATAGEVNGFPYASMQDVSEDGVIKSVVFEAGEGSFIDIDFVVGNNLEGFMAQRILGTLAK
ncbi:MAG: hypothetical protein Q4C53_05800 [Clostridia bacterium]|nr:hypothetical protein [Clostridia bacterium]